MAPIRTWTVSPCRARWSEHQPVNIPLRDYWNLLVDYLHTERRRVAALGLLLCTSIGLQLLNPQIMRSVIDSALAGGATDPLLLLAALFFGFALLQQVVTILASYTGESVAWTATNRLRHDLARHCLYLDMSFHNARTPGEMIERIDGDVQALSNFFSQFVIKVVANAVLLLGILVLLFRVDWRVGLALAVFVLVTGLTLLRLRNISVPYWKASSEAHAALFGFLEERLGGTKDIRANGAIAYTLRRFYELVRRTWQTQIKAGVMVNVMINTTMLLFTIGNATALLVGAYLFGAGSISLGTVYVIFHYSNMLMQPIEQITQQMEDLQKAGASIARVRELTGIRTKLEDGTGAVLPAGPLAVEFERVSFGYDQAEPVLRNLSFRLRPGTVLGLLGRTGSGKTTLIRLLLRLYDPARGRICAGDGARAVDLRDVHLHDLPRHIGVVTQNVQLFNASVRDNLAFFDRSIPDERILEVLAELGLGRWYTALPDGLDSELASGGAGLSAGEGQLLAFARIFLKDPGLVILDEASSRLDPATEQLIERAVERLVRHRTAIIIAHRLKTVERADEIMILDHGRILEHGSRDALADDPGSQFAALLRTGIEEVLA